MTNKNAMLFITVIFLGCATTQQLEKNHFTIKSATYQSWMKNENEKGTNVKIEMIKIKDGIVFDSIIFRELRNTINVVKIGDSTLLKTTYELGIPKLENKYFIDKRPDMLIYRLNNVKHYIVIKNWKRESMKY
jgi:hypothetical protein